MIMYENKLTISYALECFVKGKRGTCALYKNEDGILCFTGLGIEKRRVLKLWLEIGDKFYDEQTLDFYIIMRKGNLEKSKPAWFIMTTNTYQELCNSENLTQNIRCIAIVDLVKEDVVGCKNPDVAREPFCLRAEFVPSCASITFVRDLDLRNMWIYEGKKMYAERCGSIRAEQKPTAYERNQTAVNENIVIADSFSGQSHLTNPLSEV